MDHPTRRLDDPPPAASRCPKCEQDRIWVEAAAPGDILVGQRGQWGGLSIRQRSTCKALMCVECGYTELYARYPKALLE